MVHHIPRLETVAHAHAAENFPFNRVIAPSDEMDKIAGNKRGSRDVPAGASSDESVGGGPGGSSEEALVVSASSSEVADDAMDRAGKRERIVESVWRKGIGLER
jgi:hypothetical protein